MFQPLQKIFVLLEDQIERLVDDVIPAVFDKPAILVEHRQTILIELDCDLLLSSLHALWNVRRHANSPLSSQPRWSWNLKADARPYSPAVPNKRGAPFGRP